MQMKTSKLLILFNLILFASILAYVLWPAKHAKDNRLDSSLQLVAIIFRHGARSPGLVFPDDPYEKHWPDGLGQLLLKGKEEMYTLGTTLRERYKNFILNYKPEEVNVRSSDYDRTHMSAATLLAGWFPPEDEQVWSNELLWQPIPIHTVPESQDYENAFGGPCPRYFSELLRVGNESRRNESKEDTWAWDHIEKHFGRPADYSIMARYYLTLKIEESFGFEIMNWTKAIYPDKLAELHYQASRLLFWNEEMLRLYSGSMLNEILQQLKTKAEGGNYGKKIFAYSSHDINFLGVTQALGFGLDEFYHPSYGASAIFELHKLSGDDYIVKMYYLHDWSTIEPVLLNIPNCPNPCSFAKLYNITEYMRSVNHKEDCKLK